MKIALIIFDYFEYGGIQKDLAALGTDLRVLAAGKNIPLELTLVCMRNRSGSTPPWADRVEIITMPWHCRSNHARACRFDREIAAEEFRKRFDLLVGFNRIGNLDFYFAGDDCLKLRYRRRILARLLPRAVNFLKLEKQLFAAPEAGGAGTIFTITPEQRDSFLKAYPETAPTRLMLMPPLLAGEFFDRSNLCLLREECRSEAGVKSGTLLIIQIAAAFHTKGVDRSLQLLGRLKADGILPEFKFMIVGGKSERERKVMCARAAGAGLSNKEIIFTGPRQDIRRLLCGADLMLHPARAESAGSVIIEALASGVPVITSGICGYNNFVRESRAGVIIPEPFDPDVAMEKFREALRRLPEFKQRADEYASHNITPEQFRRSVNEAEIILKQPEQ